MQRRPLCLVCLLLLLGMCLLDKAGFPIVTGNPLSDSMQQWIEEHPRCTIRGEVKESKNTESSFSACLKHVSLIVGSEKIPIENVTVYFKSENELPVGTLIEVKGKLIEIEGPRNPGEFDAKQYYACRHIYYKMKNGIVQKKSRSYSVYGEFLAQLKRKLVNILEKSAGDQAGVFEAMLLGEKENLDGDLKLRYQMAGMIHILAISGLHISMLGMGLFHLLNRFGLGLKPAGFLSLLVMLQYGLLTGGSVSAMRAVCMFCLMIGAKILGRSYDLLTALSLSAALLVLDAPAYIRSSSFLLSFGAVVGIGAAGPVLQEMLQSEKKWVNSFLSSLAVQLVTLPFMLSMYGEVSVVGLLLNLVVLPTVGGVLLSGLACALLGCVSLSLAFLAAIPGRILLFLYEKLCILAGMLPFCTWIGGAPALWQSISYYVLLILGLALTLCLRKKNRWLRTAVCAAVIAIGILILSFQPQKNLEITCLDVGQGDGIVLQIPEGGTVLIDCGSSSKNNIAQYQLLPFLKHEGISYVDAVIISHTDGDHVSGMIELLTLMEKGISTVRIGRMILPEIKERPDHYLELLTLAEELKIPVNYGSAGDQLKLGKASFRFLSPEENASGTDVNADCLVTELHYGAFSGLFTGDITEDTEKKLLAGKAFQDIDLLKVAHHGSRYSSTEEFLKAVSPEIAVISCSATNTYGHPSPDTLKRLENAGSRIFCTKDSGAVTIETDGHKIKVEEYYSST